MRVLLLAVVVSGMTFTSAVCAGEFPGPQIKNEPPFNNSNVMPGSARTCKNYYSRAQFATEKKAIIADVKQCVLEAFGIEQDIGLDFGSVASPYSECVVPSTFASRAPSNNPMWPVCCAVPQQTGGTYRMACRLYFTSK